MIAIYKITSPSGKVYIGQSWDVKKRHYYYSSLNCKEQPKIYNSIKKYGWVNHLVEILKEFDSTVQQSDLDLHEVGFINDYRLKGVTLLNLATGGSNGKHSPETIEKLKAIRVGRTPTLGKKFSDESKAKMSAWQIGRKMPKDGVEKSRLANIGRKATDEAKANMRLSKSKNNIWLGRKHTETSKKKQSLAKIGNKINNKLVKRIDTGEIFNSLTEAAKSINIKPATLSARIIKNANKHPKFTYDV